jgi:hypothetical protein
MDSLFGLILRFVPRSIRPHSDTRILFQTLKLYVIQPFLPIHQIPGLSSSVSIICRESALDLISQIGKYDILAHKVQTDNKTAPSSQLECGPLLAIPIFEALIMASTDKVDVYRDPCERARCGNHLMEILRKIPGADRIHYEGRPWLEKILSTWSGSSQQ